MVHCHADMANCSTQHIAYAYTVGQLEYQPTVGPGGRLLGYSTIKPELGPHVTVISTAAPHPQKVIIADNVS